VRYAVTTQRNFRVHLVAALGVVILGAWLDLSSVAWAMLLLTIGGVLVTEMFNTAAEALVDLVSPDYHPIAKLVKDLTAGAVLVIAFIAVVVGLIVLGPPLWVRLTLILAV
jgi:diacylglycerol kinase